MSQDFSHKDDKKQEKEEQERRQQELENIWGDPNPKPRESKLSKILSIFTKRDKNRKDQAQSNVFEEIQKAFENIDLKELKLVSRRLFDSGVELCGLEYILRENPERRESYKNIVLDILKQSRSDLDALVRMLKDSGVLSCLDKLIKSQYFKENRIDLKELPYFEKSILNRLNLSSEEIGIIQKVLDSILQNPNGSSLEKVLFDNIDQLDFSPNQDNWVSILDWISSGVKIFGGTGLAGINIAAFLERFGLTITLKEAIDSVATGVVMSITGIKEITTLIRARFGREE